MKEDATKDQQEKSPDAEEEPTSLRETGGSSWESVLTEADQREDLPTSHPAPASPGGQTAVRWAKALTPVAILALYVMYKLFAGWDWQDRPALPPVLEERASLSGVEPVEEEGALDLPPSTRQFVGQLEGLRSRNRWKEIVSAVENQENETVRQHPVVQAFGVVARAHSRQRSPQLAERLRTLAATIRPAQDEYPDLYHELRIALAEQIIHWSSSEELLSRNTDKFHRLLGQEVESPYEVNVRLYLARRYEDLADNLMEKAKGYLSDDPVLVRQARVYYQMGLRWIVKRDEWWDLGPISPAAQPAVERLSGKIARANREIHGPSLPLTGNDSSTWTGKKGDPIHSKPPRGDR